MAPFAKMTTQCRQDYTARVQAQTRKCCKLFKTACDGEVTPPRCLMFAAPWHLLVTRHDSLACNQLGLMLVNYNITSTAVTTINAL